jgi:mortality factor 4-like protein 1
MSAPFNVNERVLCFHGPLIYEAKVLQAVHHDDPAPLTGKVGWHYFVHYKGWKQK